MRLNKTILLFLQTNRSVKGILALLFCALVFSNKLSAQSTVSFKAADGLSITADIYLVDKNKPFILLFHQAESSRGEYINIAPKLNKLGYNCLAVDLRAGGKSNFITNETAKRAYSNNYSQEFIDAEKDILAAVEYVKQYNHHPVILFGSSYSASLSLLIARNSKRISSVVAFSPGEYFRPELIIKESIAGLKIPIFVAASEFEYPNVKNIVADVASENKLLFKPSQGRGAHGAKALWDSNESSSEYWLNLTHFFSRL